MNEVSREGLFVEAVEVEVSQFVVADSMGKHAIDGDQDLVDHGHHGPLVSAQGFQAENLSPDHCCPN
jgi:hypothetical protein